MAHRMAIVLLLGLAACRPRTESSPPLVAGGVDLGPVPASFPLVKLRLAADGAVKGCSGVFITKNHILTAAHCLTNRRTRQLLAKGQVSVASHFVAVESFEIDSAYSDARLSRYDRAKHDLGVIVVRQPNGDAGPDALAIADAAPAAGSWVQILGYGQTSTASERLAETPRRGWNRVERVDDHFIIVPTPTSVNRGGDVSSEDDSTRAGTLPGDSGGPVLQDGKVVGICSSGTNGIGTSWISVLDARSYFVNLNGRVARTFLERMPAAPVSTPETDD